MGLRGVRRLFKKRVKESNKQMNTFIIQSPPSTTISNKNMYMTIGKQRIELSAFGEMHERQIVGSEIELCGTHKNEED